MPWTMGEWRADAGTPCPGAPGQPGDMHAMWGCRRCNPITHEAAGTKEARNEE